MRQALITGTLREVSRRARTQRPVSEPEHMGYTRDRDASDHGYYRGKLPDVCTCSDYGYKLPEFAPHWQQCQAASGRNRTPAWGSVVMLSVTCVATAAIAAGGAIVQPRLCEYRNATLANRGYSHRNC
jgi:hypothetical protein